MQEPKYQAALNTDKELWRRNDKDSHDSYYEPSIHVTQDDLIGIDVGGTVVLKTVEDWHKMATNGGWNNARISPPLKSGRYWAVIAIKTEIGMTYCEWNCHFDLEVNVWTDGDKIIIVSHWMPLRGFPFLLIP